MATSEIEKLERRYAENPQGLTFAPLAEVHRKTGDLARALELLQAGLELHPNYIPASIVLGRCHQDLGDLAAAEAAFAHVLRLDEENVIALKSLADISEKQERFDEAEAWLHRLISVDRSNDEAREQLRRIGVAKEQSPRPAEPEAAEPEVADQPLPFIAGTEPEAMVEEPTPSAAEESTPSETAGTDLASVDSLDLTVDSLELMEEIADAPSPPSTMLDKPVEAAPESQPSEAPSLMEAEEPVQPMAGLMSAEFQPPSEEPAGIGVETDEDVVLESSEASEFRVPDASEDFVSMAARLSAGNESPPARTEAAAPEEFRPHPELEFVLTETMAEVLLQQGHPVDALRIYRELLRRKEGDTRLQSRVEEVEAVVARQAERSPSYSALETNGQSVVAFFRTMLAARLPADSSSAGSAYSLASTEGGAPTRPAQDALSLSSVFGEDSLPVPPAVPATEQRTEAGVSFDAFFSPPDEGSTSVKSRSADPGNDDLDQFHSWLQNLKR